MVEQTIVVNFDDQNHKKALFEILKTLKGTNTISINKCTRSSQLNRYYWDVVVGEVSEFTGMKPKEVHSEFKKMFLFELDMSTGRKKRPSTAKLSNKQFLSYLEQCYQFSSEFFGLILPDPKKL